MHTQQRETLSRALLALKDAKEHVAQQEQELDKARTEAVLRAKAVAFAIRDLRTIHDVSVMKIARALLSFLNVERSIVTYTHFEDSGEENNDITFENVVNYFDLNFYDRT